MYYPPPFCSPATSPFPVQPQMHQTPPQETANVVTQNDIATIMNNVVQMQQQTLQQMHGMLTNLSNTSQSGRGGGRGGRGYRGTRAVRGGRGSRSNQQHQQNQNQTQNLTGSQARVTPGYCWTHGYQGRTGAEFNNPANGHISHATLTNRMGGSNYNVSPGL